MNKRLKILFIVLISLIIFIFIKLFILSGSCGIDGCHNNCEKSSDCEFYDIIGTCRNQDYKFSNEHIRRMLSFQEVKKFKNSTICECVSSGQIKKCETIYK